MAQTKQETITQVFINNSTMPTTVSRVVEQVVVNNRLVPDFRAFNAGVTDPVVYQPQG